MQKQTVDVIVGRRVEDAEVQADAGRHQIKAGSAVPPPPGDEEVEGRSGYTYIKCPCGAMNYVWVDDYTFIWYRCAHCHQLFKA